MDYNALSKLCLELGGESPNATISDEHLATVASELTEWEPLAPHLGIVEAEEKEIHHDSSSYKDQKINALRKWKQSCGVRATYKELSCILSNVPVEPSVLVSLESHLKKCYQKARSPTVLQWPKLKHSTYVEPVMYEVPVEEESQSTPGIMPATTRSEKPVELEAIFSAEQGGEVVLLEGVAGVGKTMLTWHASRMWAEGYLFPDTQLLIHISLRNKHFHSASCLTDLIPHPSKRLCKEIASTMVKKRGRGVCFIFDGWDELPPEVQDNSFLLDFISRQGPYAALPECSILVTSRPHASASLTPYIARKIEIQGFNKKQLRKYLSDSTEGSEKATDKLMKAVSKNPQLTLLCLIPLMAAILVFLFSFTDNTESRYVLTLKTHTEMFKVLVINLLLRHMQLRVRHRQKKLREISNLPPDLQEKFKIVCRVAFYGVVSDKAVFDFDDLESLGISSEIDTLGMMQANEQLTWFGPTKDYSFLHHHIQTFLAGYHISQLPYEKHAIAVRKVLRKHPLSSALTVYGGLSKLNNKEALDVLLEVSKMPLDVVSVMTGMAQYQDVGSDRRRLLLALLRCIYEAQSPQLYLLVKPPLNPIYSLSRSTDIVPFSFDGLSLTTADCHVFTHFVSAVVPSSGVFLSLAHCSLKDEEVNAMMLMLHCTINATKRFSVNFCDNHITHRGVHSIARTLTTPLVTGLFLDGNWHPESTDIRLAFKYLIEGLSRNSSCYLLGIGDNSLTEEHVHYLVLLFAFCVSLRILYLDWNKLGNSISLITAAMNKSSVTLLFLRCCAITNHQLLQLGKALQENTSFLELYLSHNPFTPAAFADFLRCLMPQPPTLGPPLELITVTCQLTDEHKQLVEEINQMRAVALYLHHGTMIIPHRLTVKHPNDIARWNATEAPISAFHEAQRQSPEFVTGQSSMEHLYTS